ncbi:DUF4192 family protein [Leucobacter sp. HY1908]
MTNHTATSPQVLKCSGTADFLAALPQLAGFTASHSIFVLFFDGARTREAMRVDLPAGDDPHETADLLEFLSYAIRSFGTASGHASAPAIAIMSDQTFAECSGPPWQRLARRIERRLKRDRIYPRELCVQAPDGWVSFLDPAAPRSGRSLTEITGSPVAAATCPEHARVPSLAELGALPPPDPDRMQRAAATLARLDHEAEARGRALGALAAQRTRVSLAPDATRALRSPSTPLSPEDTGVLAHVLAEPGSWWHVSMGVITRPEFPAQLEREFGLLTDGRLPVDDPPTARSEGVLVAPNCSMLSLFASVGPEFTERDRLAPLRPRLARALADLPAVARPGVFALSALVWWLCGNQTTANNQVDAALELAPGHDVARMVRKLVAVPVLARQMVTPGQSRAAVS